jgi:hypothetical protein
MMHPDTELLMHLAANLVREYPNGVSTIQMHLRMAISLDKARKILCFARKARLLGVAGSGVTARWASPERAAELDAGRWSKRKLQHKACRDRRTAKIAARQAASELAPKRVAKPFKIHAPNSVWQLAEFSCAQLKQR